MKGSLKLKYLVEFLEKSNPQLLEKYILKLQNDNNLKFQQYANTLSEMEIKKGNVLKEKENLKLKADEKEQKINEFIIKNKKKSNEIDELNDRIKQLEDEIKKKQN
jgi:hypothetical protein